MTRLAPLPAGATVIGLLVVAFASTHPLTTGAIAVAGLLLVCDGRTRLPFLAGVGLGSGVLLVTPLAGANGDLILIGGPNLSVLDLEVTFEELVEGAVLGLRAAAVVWICAGALARVDDDRLLARTLRVAPQSALAVAAGVRLLPVLAADARAVVEVARGRGRSPLGRPVAAAVRDTSRLLVPLLASSLERSLDQAEALTARGYPGTRVGPTTEAALTTREWALVAAAAGAAAAALVARARGDLGHAYSPHVEAVLGVGTAGTAALAVAVAVIVRMGWR